MYLKSIEVNGFKSFAHKMIFKFEHGITGIVGPNGSGKSNVADAVRWVLGEQRAKQLRGSRMEDVIFSGTELRKPMGSAYVAITLDNSDHSLPIQFEEVTVARRVYRSGESEYLINGSACRRKDIVELFFDTGIGKEGYSIIGQGQIEQILSGKPEERRELFDEAAGIVKYKKNKLETQKSLEIERENLVRVTDILTELERQVGPLKKQSERAREYLLLRDQLKDEDVKLFLLENQNLEKELKELDEKIEIAQREINEANQTLAKAKEKYGKQEEFLDHLKQEIETITAHISEMKITKQQKEGKIQGNSERKVKEKKSKDDDDDDYDYDDSGSGGSSSGGSSGGGSGSNSCTGCANRCSYRCGKTCSSGCYGSCDNDCSSGCSGSCKTGSRLDKTCRVCQSACMGGCIKGCSASCAKSCSHGSAIDPD